MSREELKQEALKRMKLIKLSPQCIKAFETKNKVWTSERGILYDDANVQKLVEAFEKNHPGYLVYHVDHSYLVYHVDHTLFTFGDCYSFFVVSPYQEDWQIETDDLKDGYAFCYVKNIDDDYDDFCSEFGTIAFKPVLGGVCRVN